jgi:hypothetical protein
MGARYGNCRLRLAARPVGAQQRSGAHGAGKLRSSRPLDVRCAPMLRSRVDQPDAAVRRREEAVLHNLGRGRSALRPWRHAAGHAACNACPHAGAREQAAGVDPRGRLLRTNPAPIEDAAPGQRAIGCGPRVEGTPDVRPTGAEGRHDLEPTESMV